MSGHLAYAWYTAFVTTVQRHDAAKPLQEAAAAGRLSDWTEALTGVVVDVCSQMGWETAARWHPTRVLPVSRREYLELDAVAFDVRPAPHVPWPLPVAVLELENSRDDDKVAYALWKVLCVQAQLRVVLCYRRDLETGSALVHHLADAVIDSMPIRHRQALSGQILLVVGSRAEEAAFPYGYFREWLLDKNTGHFYRM